MRGDDENKSQKMLFKNYYFSFIIQNNYKRSAFTEEEMIILKPWDPIVFIKPLNVTSHVTLSYYLI